MLPIVPILLGSAASAHPRAPLALAAGLALSYAVVGSTLAWAGANLGIDGTVFRTMGAAILGLLGLVLLSAGLQRRFAAATAGIGDAGNNALSRLRLDGLRGQFAIGLALGVVWSPCVGPTLGAAIVLAARVPTCRQWPADGRVRHRRGLPVVALAYRSRSAMSGAWLAAAGGQGWQDAARCGAAAVAVFILSGSTSRSKPGWSSIRPLG